MTEEMITPGKTTIAIDVLLTIARLTALEVPGISRMSQVPTRRVKSMLLRRQYDEGVDIDVKEDTVYVDLYVILQQDVNLRDVGRNIQTSVARAISDMIGMQVGQVNVHIEDIDYFQES